MTRPVPRIAVTFVEGVEAERLTAYQDDGGVWTNGFGNTDGVTKGLVITHAQALVDLGRNLGIAASRLALRVNEAAILALDDHQYAALLSFVFNLGAGPGWEIWADLNGGHLADVPAQMMRFDKESKGGQEVVVPGLINRRMAEVNLWKTADVPSSVAIMQAAPVAPPPSSYTRAAVTPPTAAVVAPLASQPHFIAAAGSAAATVGAVGLPMVQQAASGVKSVSDAITPYADASDAIAKVVHTLALVAAVLAVATLVFVWLKHRAAKAA